MNIMKNSFLLFLFTVAMFSLHSETPPMSPTPNRCEKAIQRLKEGNVRFQHDDQTLCLDINALRRLEIIQHQEPFAAVVCCSDSRAAPELVFDQGLGDLFVVRVAGNVVGPVELDSIDYATAVLGSCIVVVLGHENCGAVSAVVKGQAQGIPAVAKLIEPAVQQAKKEKGEFTLEKAITTNVMMTVKWLEETPVIKDLIRQKKVQVVGAIYHFKTGEVEFL